MSAEEPEQPEGQQNEQQEDPNSLNEQDKKVYAEIMSSINRMDKKLKNVKQKVPSQEESAGKFDMKKTSVNQITDKLIESKQNSDIITKEDLVTDVQQTFEEMVVNVYSENKQLKNKISSLIAIIKQQNRKINQHKDKQQSLRLQNEQLRAELVKQKDANLYSQHLTTNKKQGSPNNASKIVKNVGNRSNTHENQDYDFWSMPNNESSVNNKKRKDFVADSGLWVNDKDIDKSVFITDQKTRR